MGYVVHTSSNMKTWVHFLKFSSIETSRSMQIAAWSDPKRGRWITLIRKNLLIKLIVAKPMSRNPWIFASSCLPFNQVYEYPSKPELIKPHRSKVWRLHNKHYKLIKKIQTKQVIYIPHFSGCKWSLFLELKLISFLCYNYITHFQNHKLHILIFLTKIGLKFLHV